MEKNRLKVVHYEPPGGYPLDIEIISASELRLRAALTSRAHRVNFFHLIAFTEGSCRHMVDFQLIDCCASSWLLLWPGQVHSFDFRSDWQGWILVCKDDFLPTSLDTKIDPLLAGFQDLIPFLSILGIEEQKSCIAGIEIMLRDIQSFSNHPEANALLRCSFSSLLLRLRLAHQPKKNPASNQIARKRLARFKKILESDVHVSHEVGYFARALGCSEKSLNRTTQEISGTTTKRFIDMHIALEAKRMIAHTNLPISVIGSELGFDEATNFVKFFKRLNGMTPSEFRVLHLKAQSG